jgi:succinate dehydrogenase / fumarate reductase flavoprotein subunit
MENYNSSNIKTLEFDALIIGGGGSGMRTSLELAKSGLKTAVVSKVFPTRSHTVSAQGGITCAIASEDPNDDWRWHMYDTGKGIRLHRRSRCNRIYVFRGTQGSV